MGTRAIRSSNENEYYTPVEYLEAAREVLGGIDIDPASSFTANRTVKARVFFDEQADGLQQGWTSIKS